MGRDYTVSITLAFQHTTCSSLRTVTMVTCSWACSSFPTFSLGCFLPYHVPSAPFSPPWRGLHRVLSIYSKARMRVSMYFVPISVSSCHSMPSKSMVLGRDNTATRGGVWKCVGIMLIDIMMRGHCWPLVDGLKDVNCPTPHARVWELPTENANSTPAEKYCVAVLLSVAPCEM